MANLMTFIKFLLKLGKIILKTNFCQIYNTRKKKCTIKSEKLANINFYVVDRETNVDS